MVNMKQTNKLVWFLTCILIYLIELILDKYANIRKYIYNCIYNVILNKLLFYIWTVFIFQPISHLFAVYICVDIQLKNKQIVDIKFYT